MPPILRYNRNIMFMKSCKPTLLLLFISSFIIIQSSTKDSTKPESDNYKSGLEKLKNIMLDPDEGIPADYQKNPDDYAQIRNIDQDLNIDEIVKFFGCSTSMCETYLREALLHPFSAQGKEQMLQRQRIIRLLVENPELKAQVDALIAQAKEKEPEIAKLFSEGFKGEHCPDLQTVNQPKNEDSTKESKKYDGAIRSNNYYFANRVFWTTMFLSYEVLLGYSGASSLIIKMPFNPELTTKAIGLLANTVHHVVPGFFSIKTWYNDYRSAHQKRAPIADLNHMITLSADIEALSEEYKFELEHGLKNIMQSPDDQKFITALNDNRFADKKARLFLPLFVHNMLYTIYKNKEQLAQIFASIGELDALNAIATKIIEHKDKNNSFCFTEVVESDKPQIQADNFWNVLVKNPVLNDFNENKNVILTGPNAGGKSTVIRSLLQNIIFAQFAGFAAGSKFNATFFDIIHSYLSISDDLKNDMSLFDSEVKRGEEVRDVKESLEDTHKKFFCALDELFTGTAGEDGEYIADEFIRQLFKSPYMLCIYATHFDKLKKIAQEKDSNCANYKIGAPTKDEAGKLHYPYTFGKGVNNERFGIHMAKMAGLI